MDVIIVDSDEGIEGYYSGILESEFRGIALKFFSHAQPALDHIRAQSCDLVISDAALPDMQIFSFIEKVCEARVPVLLVSGEASERLIVECLRAGALDFLSKQEIKLGVLPKILKRAFLEADRWCRIQEFTLSLPHRPEYFKINDEVRSFVAHERAERARTQLSRGFVGQSKDLVDGQLYTVIYLYLQLQIPQSLIQTTEPERLNAVRSTLLARAAAISDRYGGREWTRKNDGAFFGFIGDGYLPAVLAALEVHSMMAVFNVFADNLSEPVGVNLGLAAGQTVYREHKGDIYSEALNLSAHIAMSNGMFNSVMITQEVMDSLTPRARKYFFRSEKFENHPVYHFEVVS